MNAQRPLLATGYSDRKGTTAEDPFARISSLEGRNADLEEANRQLRCDVRRLQRLVYLDPLTGLGNRRHFDAVLASELRRAARTGEPLTLLMCDVDHFKDCNDAYGHEVGDSVLIEIGAVLKEYCRRGGDLAIRYAGDEFALLLPGVHRSTAEPFANHLRTAIAALSIHHRTWTVRECVTLSIGGTIFRPAEPCSAACLVETADRALYHAKRAGRNRTAFANYA